MHMPQLLNHRTTALLLPVYKSPHKARTLCCAMRTLTTDANIPSIQFCHCNVHNTSVHQLTTQLLKLSISSRTAVAETQHFIANRFPVHMQPIGNEFLLPQLIAHMNFQELHLGEDKLPHNQSTSLHPTISCSLHCSALLHRGSKRFWHQLVGIMHIL